MKKLAFVDLTNYTTWPIGGMLEYELAILPYIAQSFDVDLWGVSVDGVSTATYCELPSFLHQRILEGAVMLALRSKGINISENK